MAAKGTARRKSRAFPRAYQLRCRASGHVTWTPEQDPPTASCAETNIGALGEPFLPFPTTLAQESFWYLTALSLANPAEHRRTLSHQGPLDVSILERCVNEIVRRHEIFAFSFALVDGALAQIVSRPKERSLCRWTNLSHLPSPARDAEENGEP